METDIKTVSELVRHAAAICDPDGQDDVVASIYTRFEDDDRPAFGVDDLRGELRGMLDGVDPEGDSATAAMTAAVATFLATQPGQADKPEVAMREGARLFWQGEPPEPIRDWLADEGVEL